MFDSLSDRIRADEHQAIKATERWIRLAAVVLLSVVLFGGLYYGIKMLEY